MNKISILAAGVSAAACGAMAYAAAPASAPPPIASYWMDVSTAGGLGAGMTPGGGRPSMSQIMGMMSGSAPSVMHTLDLRLASKTKPTTAPEANHLIPPGLQMGASLPLITPQVAKPVKETYGMPQGYEKPKGRMLIYWGCGEHAGAGQPTVIDFSKLAAGQVPPGMAAMANAARMANVPHTAPGFGEWPNNKDNRQVPATGSLLGAHKVEGNYSPPIAFTLAQDFMPGLNLHQAGSLPSGAARLAWTPAPTATGYALAMFGSNGNGDVLMWSSSKSPAMTPLMDYLPPAEVKRLIGTGHVMPPTTSECVLPAEVVTASPAGMIMAIGYGPEANFAEAPKAPKWVAKARFKTTASLMLGMPQMGGMDSGAGQPGTQQQQPKKKKKFGLGDVLKGAVGIPSE
ncbi:hypothetical protein LZ016_11320 [Sphingomonas sp. SM33]|uniref:Uncharacterized protein n=1 Tax=Sphingomonas telluris TaxID=2907998 RepID=A0ABS9VNY1_9SPHN|nr:hypothetical protein [Sphingomonas telluris]MCH8616686.1 hypothetical protein [Sphingomonas telluris]